MSTMSPSPARRRAWLPAAAAAFLLLGGCGTGADLAPEPAATAQPQQEAPRQDDTSRGDDVGRSIPDVPIQRADLGSQQAEEVVPPTGVTIPSIDVVLPVEPVGVEADGEMEIPPRAEIGGWYRFGASPAQDTGTAVIAAHVDSVASAGVGPFARLRDLGPGDTVEVALADGTTRSYTVTSVVRTPKPEVTWDDVFVRDGAHRLVLITCGGSFQRDARSYTDNVIVTAEPSD